MAWPTEATTPTFYEDAVGAGASTLDVDLVQDEKLRLLYQVKVNGVRHYVTTQNHYLSVYGTRLVEYGAASGIVAGEYTAARDTDIYSHHIVDE